MEKLFDHIMVTDELDDVKYAEMYYAGDNAKKDFITPEKVEMKSIWFRNKDSLYYQAD